MVDDNSGNTTEVGNVGNCPALEVTVRVWAIDNCLDGVSITVVYIGDWSYTGVTSSVPEFVIVILSPVLAIIKKVNYHHCH